MTIRTDSTGETPQQELEDLTKKHIGHLMPVTYDENGHYDEPAILEYFQALTTRENRLIAEAERMARIDELNGIQLIYGHYVATTFINGKPQSVADRLKALQSEGTE